MIDLHDAALYGDLDWCRELIENGADVNTYNKWGYTALHEAARLGHLEICELLVNHGADVHAKDDKARTPLHWAAKRKYLDICEYLFLKCGAKMKKASFKQCEYREYSDSQLKKLFDYFKWETDELLFDILTKPDRTIRPFIDALIHNGRRPSFDHMVGPYACDLLCLYHRYPQIRDYLEHGFGFQKTRYSIDHAYLKRYRTWVNRWRFKHRCHQIKMPIMVPTFTHRLTQNIQ